MIDSEVVGIFVMGFFVGLGIGHRLAKVGLSQTFREVYNLPEPKAKPTRQREEICVGMMYETEDHLRLLVVPVAEGVWQPWHEVVESEEPWIGVLVDGRRWYRGAVHSDFHLWHYYPLGPIPAAVMEEVRAVQRREFLDKQARFEEHARRLRASSSGV